MVDSFLLRKSRPGLLVALAALSACSEKSVPTWTELARLPAVEASLVEQGRLANGREVRIRREDGAVWLVHRLAREDWKALGDSGRFSARPGLYGAGRPPEGADPFALEAPGTEFELELSAEAFDARPGRFFVRRGEVLLQLERGEEPPAESAFVVPATHARPGSQGRTRVAGRRFSGTGFSVWPGETRSVEVDVAGGQVLRFGTVAEQAHRAVDDEEGTTFRLRVDGEPVFELAETQVNQARWHAVELPVGPARRVTFEVEGAFAFSSFLDPVLGPLEVGDYGARPWEENRPDLVLFLADTYRADNLDVYGGGRSLTPHLDRLASEGRVFERAWSVSTHTLPAQSSMLTGVYPPQNGQLGFDGALPEEALTITELLAARGYRTVAVTDALMVSQIRGMDQGFGFFDEQTKDFDWTMERLRPVLGADDGRPLFLFVQSYAAHAPYHPSEVARRELGVAGSYDDLTTHLKRSEADADRLDLGDVGTVEAAAGLDALYRAGAADLDRGFAELRGELEERGLFPRGYLMVTSDHGEAFTEHGEIFHGGRVFEEQLRIPLIVAGGGLRPGRVSHGASLVDLAPTLADLAGLRAPDAWGGESWLRLEEDRPIIAFQSRQREDSTLAVVRGSRKIVLVANPDALARRELVGAYDLVQDPEERHDLSTREAWPAEMLEELAPRLEPLFEPLVEGTRPALGSDALEFLGDMGYASENP